MIMFGIIALIYSTDMRLLSFGGEFFEVAAWELSYAYFWLFHVLQLMDAFAPVTACCIGDVFQSGAQPDSGARSNTGRTIAISMPFAPLEGIIAA